MRKQMGVGVGVVCGFVWKVCVWGGIIDNRGGKVGAVVDEQSGAMTAVELVSSETTG